MSFKTKQIMLFVGAVVTTIGMFLGGFYLMATMIPPAVDAFVNAFGK